MTEKRYEQDSYLTTFCAEVLTCEPCESGEYAVELSSTAFFPEGGGQFADTGTLGGAQVTDVQMKADRILHFTDRALEPGKQAEGMIDFAQRFLRMQNHTGEHIVSGLMHSCYGLDNVGFHLGHTDVTIDFNGPLTSEQLTHIETLANEAVWRNLPVTASFPSTAELAAMDYRSKIELTGSVRIVTIDGIDRCACCAPHVSRTGEIGLIKLLEATRYKGGTRVRMLCGKWALFDYREKFQNIYDISCSLSTSQDQAAAAVGRLRAELSQQQQAIHTLQEKLLEQKLASLTHQPGNRCLFEESIDPVLLRKLCDGAKASCSGICAAFCGNDKQGYQFVMGSNTVALKAHVKEITGALCGRGGGSSEMIQGTVCATRDQIEAFFETFLV